MKLTLPLDAEELIPHRLPMRLVDRLVKVDGKDGVVEASVTSTSPLVDATGLLEGVAMTELLAQAYAAIKGYCDRLDGKPVRQGFLVGIKKVTCLKNAQVGDRLRIDIRTLAEVGDFAVAEGDVWCDDEQLAHGEIKVWIN